MTIPTRAVATITVTRDTQDGGEAEIVVVVSGVLVPGDRHGFAVWDDLEARVEGRQFELAEWEWQDATEALSNQHWSDPEAKVPNSDDL